MQSCLWRNEVRRFAWMVILVVAVALPVTARAEEKKPFVIVSTASEITAPDQPDENLAVELRARKGVAQRVYLFVRNPKEDAVEGVSVQFRTSPTDDKPQKVTLNLGKRTEKTGTQRVKFQRPPGELKPILLAEPRFQVRIAENPADEKNEDLWKWVNIASVPSNRLVEVQSVSLDPKTNTLTAKLAAKKDLDTSCQIVMEVLPERLPGLQQAVRVSRPLTKGGVIELVAKLPIAPGEVGDGTVYFHVDQATRAFVYTVPYGGTPGSDQTGRAVNDGLYLRAPLFCLSGAKLSIGVEIVGAGFDGRIDLDLGHVADDKFVAETRCPDKFPGKRSPLATFESFSSDDGAALFSVTIPDRNWELTADETKDLAGEKFVQGSIDEKLLKSSITPIYFIKDAPAITKLVINRKNGDIYEIVAESPTAPMLINRAVFFVGKAEGGKEPEGVPVVPVKYDPERKAWVAEMELTDEKATISGHLVNRVALGAFRDVAWVRPPALPPLGATISGLIEVGGLAQKGIEVKLATKPATTPATPDLIVKTDEKGRYTFGDVKAGTYTVSSVKDSGAFKRTGSKDVTVKSGDKKLKEDLSLTQPPPPPK